MDVMRPDIVWVEDSAYRVNQMQMNQNPEEEENMMTGQEDADGGEEMIAAVPIEEWKGGYRALLDIPSALYGQLIGRSGKSLRQVEDQSRCKVTIPKGPRPKVNSVEVFGEQRRNVVRACNMLMMTADRGRQKIVPSHFVGIRMATQHAQNRMDMFKREAMAVGAEARGIRPELFQEPGKLHLTVCMLVLLDESERNRAAQTLNNHADELRSLLPEGGLHLRMRGLDIMNDDPREARVVYARVEEREGGVNCLQHLANRAQDIMVATGLGKRDRDGVKLHCTLMNTSFLVRDMPETHPDFQKLLSSTFDATAILRECGQFDFGTVPVTHLEVLQRQRAATEDGFYLPIGSTSLM